MKDLYSYVPESLHTHQKHQKPCRIFPEECAVIEPERSFCILASRGGNLPVGADFFNTCGILAADANLLRSHCKQQTRFLLPCKSGSAFLLGDLLEETGLLLGLLLPWDAEEVFCAMRRLGQDAPTVPQRLLPKEDLLSRPYNEVLCDRLEELFYYLEKILHSAPEASLWTRCLLIANFSGCRLERVALPVNAPRLSKGDDARMTLFLLCSFLTLRQKSGEVWAEGKAPQNEADAPNYQCTVSFFEETEPFLEPDEACEKEVSPMEIPLFLQAPCFSSLTATATPDSMRLETKFPLLQKENALGAVGSRQQIHLRFQFTRVPKKENA